MRGIDGGGSGKLAGGVAGPGVGWFVGAMELERRRVAFGTAAFFAPSSHPSKICLDREEEGDEEVLTCYSGALGEAWFTGDSSALAAMVSVLRKKWERER